MEDSGSPAGWYPEPSGAPGLRWWDGAAWSGHVHAGWVPTVVAPDPAPARAGHRATAGAVVLTVVFALAAPWSVSALLALPVVALSWRAVRAAERFAPMAMVTAAVVVAAAAARLALHG